MFSTSLDSYSQNKLMGILDIHSVLLFFYNRLYMTYIMYFLVQDMLLGARCLVTSNRNLY